MHLLALWPVCSDFLGAFKLTLPAHLTHLEASAETLWPGLHPRAINIRKMLTPQFRTLGHPWSSPGESDERPGWEPGLARPLGWAGVASLRLPTLLSPFWPSSHSGGPLTSALGITTHTRPFSESRTSAHLCHLCSGLLPAPP